jgi:hypothetical protein
MRNVGQTPAYSVTQRSEIALFPHPLPPKHRFPAVTGEGSPPSVLFPNVPFNGAKTASQPFSVDEIANIRNRTARIYIFGNIQYRDAFRKRRWTTFAVGVAADDATLAKLTSNYGPSDLKITFQHAPIGNDAN